MTLIKEYTPLWRGVGECGKTDCINIPIDREFWFWMPPVINMGQTTYQLVTDLGGGVFAHINFQDSINLGADGFIGMIRVPSNGIAQFTKSDGTGLIGIDVAGTCKTLQLATWTVLGFDTIVGLINEFFVFNFVPERACEDNLVQVKYKLDCDQSFDYTLYLSGAFVRLPLTLEDEVNAIRPDGRSKRVYSRFQTAKELRIRPVTLATHELLEHVLNMNSYEVDGFEVTPVAGAVYTPALDTGIGMYSGRIALVVGAEVKRECCDNKCGIVCVTFKQIPDENNIGMFMGVGIDETYDVLIAGFGQVSPTPEQTAGSTQFADTSPDPSLYFAFEVSGATVCITKIADPPNSGQYFFTFALLNSIQGQSPCDYVTISGNVSNIELIPDPDPRLCAVTFDWLC